MSVIATESLIKQPSEKRQYSMDFAALLDTGESLESLQSISHIIINCNRGDTLTISNTSIYEGNKIFFWVEGGQKNDSYRISIVVKTTHDQILEGDGILSIRD